MAVACLVRSRPAAAPRSAPSLAESCFLAMPERLPALPALSERILACLLFMRYRPTFLLPSLLLLAYLLALLAGLLA